VNTALQVDVTLEVGGQAQQVTVSDSAVHVETERAQMGEVVPDNAMTGVALNGRSFTDLDARNFLSPERAFYLQNQSGGTLGGPIKKGNVFFFADYQGTRTDQGLNTGLISLPSLTDRTGNFVDQAGSLKGVSAAPISTLAGRYLSQDAEVRSNESGFLRAHPPQRRLPQEGNHVGRELRPETSARRRPA
jgi:hypothetical protein